MIDWRKYGPSLVMAILAVVCLVMGAAIMIDKMRATATQARLNQGQATAAIESGSDAVSAVGATEAQGMRDDITSRENDHAIRSASGAGQAVGQPVHDAGLASLCRRRVYQRDPQCLQFTASAGLAERRERGGAAAGQ